MFLIGQKWLYSRKSGCFRESGCNRAQVVVFGKSGCIRAKNVVFEQSC